LVDESCVERAPVALALELLFEQPRLEAFATVCQAPVAGIFAACKGAADPSLEFRELAQGEHLAIRT